MTMNAPPTIASTSSRLPTEARRLCGLVGSAATAMISTG